MDLVLGRHAGDDADAVDLAHRLVVAHRAELGAGDGPALDAELVRDRLRGDGMVAGDHPDLDAGRLRLRDGGLCRRPRRVDDADDGEERQPVDGRQQVGVRVERRRVEVLLAGRHDPQAHRPEPFVLGEVGVADLGDRDLGAVGAVGGDWPAPGAGRVRP